MTPRKSHRVRKARTIWEQKGAPPAPKDPRNHKEKSSFGKKNSVDTYRNWFSSKNTVDFDADHLSELSTYKPPLNLEFKALELLVTGLTELHTFQKLLMPAIIDIIVDATNSYAKIARTNGNQSMEWPLRSDSVNQGRTEVVWTVLHIYAKEEPVLSAFIAVKTTNSSLSPVSNFILGAKDYREP